MGEPAMKNPKNDELEALRAEVARLRERVDDLQSEKEELTERTLELFSLFELTSALTTNVRFDQLSSDSMDWIGDLLGIEQFSILLQDPTDKRLYIRAALGIPQQAREQCVITPPEGVAGHVFSTGEAMYIPDVTNEPRYLYYKGLNPQGGSLLSVPLVDDDLVAFGVLNISKPEPNAFSDRDLALFSTVALHVGNLVLNYTSYRRMQELSLTDELTQAANRRAFFETLEREHERHRRYGKVYALLLIDIDYFKRYNDRHGHLEGDLALRRMSEIICGRLRKPDFFARYGGEEFAIIASETDREEARALAESLRKKVERTKFKLTNGQPASELSITIGLAAYPEHGARAIEVLDRADKALYFGKSRGRNIVSVDVPREEPVFGSPNEIV